MEVAAKEQKASTSLMSILRRVEKEGDLGKGIAMHVDTCIHIYILVYI
jgi:hypothetical protein